jgi:hypothetical protein
MSVDRKVVLNQDEAELVDEALADHLDRLTGSGDEVARIRALGFRLQVKLSSATRWNALENGLADWQLGILQRTFAPAPAKPKPKPAAKPKAVTARPAAAKVAPGPLAAEHERIARSHRSAAAKAAAHKALNDAGARAEA